MRRYLLVALPFAVAIVGTMLTHAGTVEAQTVNWVSAGSPSARCCMAMAYDPATRSTVLFGGTDGQDYGDTWIWRGGWLQMSPWASPSPRSYPAMAFDGTGNMVLFGGNASDGTFLTDTWTWDGTTWTQQFPPVSPPGRAQTGMVYDPARGNIVLFGGYGSNNVVIGDTWTWDGRSKTWTKRNPASSPSARSAPMTYDQTSQAVFLFGGNGTNEGDEFTDTWNWNGTTWTQQFPAFTPQARTSASMTYDSGLGGVVLFGGYAGVWEDSLNDTWTWNGTMWTEIYPATAPPNRYSFGMDYDPANKVVLMFGGYSSGPARGDTWLLELAP